MNRRLGLQVTRRQRYLEGAIAGAAGLPLIGVTRRIGVRAITQYGVAMEQLQGDAGGGRIARQRQAIAAVGRLDLVG